MSWFSSLNGSSNAYLFNEGGTLAGKLYANAGKIGEAVYNDSREIWNREDTAVQRWVKDVEAAGLNPYGFTGQGAATGSSNPSMDSLTSLIQVLGGFINQNNLANSTLTSSTKAVNNVLNAFEQAVGLAGRFMF